MASKFSDQPREMPPLSHHPFSALPELNKVPAFGVAELHKVPAFGVAELTELLDTDLLDAELRPEPQTAPVSSSQSGQDAQSHPNNSNNNSNNSNNSSNNNNSNNNNNNYQEKMHEGRIAHLQPEDAWQFMFDQEFNRLDAAKKTDDVLQKGRISLMLKGRASEVLSGK
ncbi:unnamed protein product, partial [Polarella glacialis]